MHHFLFTSHACYFVSGDVTYFLQLYSFQSNSIDMVTVQYNFLAFSFIQSAFIFILIYKNRRAYIKENGFLDTKLNLYDITKESARNRKT